MDALPSPVLSELLGWVDMPSLFCAGSASRRIRAASLDPALWTEPPCAAWRQLSAREALLASLRTDRRRRAGLVDRWRLPHCPPRIDRDLSVLDERLALCGDRLALGHRRRSVAIYDLPRRQRTHSFLTSAEAGESVLCVCIRADGSGGSSSVVVAAGTYRRSGMPGRLSVWMAPEKKPAALLARLPGATIGVWSTCWIDDHRLAVSDTDAHMWDLHAGAGSTRFFVAPNDGQDFVTTGPTRIRRMAGDLVAVSARRGVWLCDPRSSTTAASAMFLKASGSAIRVAIGGPDDRTLVLQCERPPYDENVALQLEVYDVRAPNTPVASAPTFGNTSPVGVVRRDGADACCLLDRSSPAASVREVRCADLATPLGPAIALPDNHVPVCARGDEARLVYAALHRPGTLAPTEGIHVLEYGPPAGRIPPRLASLRPAKRPRVWTT